MSRPPVRDEEALLRSYERRIKLLERRLSGGGGSTGTITEGTGIDITGGGTVADPYVIAAIPEPTPSIIPRVPTSVQSGGGSFVQTGHKVAFTGVTSISLNGVFSAAYDDYEVEVRLTAPSGGGWLRLRVAGVDVAAAGTYGNQVIYNNSNTALGTYYSAIAGWMFSPVTWGHSGMFKAKISTPNTPSATQSFMYLEASALTASAMHNYTNAGNTVMPSADGFSVVASSGTMTGWLRIYART